MGKNQTRFWNYIKFRVHCRQSGIFISNGLQMARKRKSIKYVDKLIAEIVNWNLNPINQSKAAILGLLSEDQSSHCKFNLHIQSDMRRIFRCAHTSIYRRVCRFVRRSIPLSVHQSVTHFPIILTNASFQLLTLIEWKGNIYDVYSLAT